MMTINFKITKSIVTALFLFALSAIFAISASAAPKLYFEPAPVNLPNGVETQINLKIDAESTSVFGADAVLNFPSSDITVTSVTNGGFFSDFSFAPSTGKLEIHAFFSSAYDSKSGSGTVAVIKLKGNKDSGAGQISFTCTGSGETEILRASDGNNILSCSSLTTLTASYGGTSGGNNNNDTNANSTPDPNATNSCGGTCGSNYNCNSGLYCYSGFCRNPDCPNSNTCGCTATAKPTVKASPKTGGKPTPEIVILSKSTAKPSAAPSVTPEPTTEESATTSSNPKAFDVKKFGMWAGLAILLFIVLSAIASLFKGKDQPPKVSPPTTTEPPIIEPPTITTTTVEPPLSNYQSSTPPPPPPPWQNPPQTPPTPQV